MHSHSIFAARDLGGIGSSLDYRGDNYGVAHRCVWCTGYYDPIANPDVRVFGKSLVDRDRALRRTL
jgi:hypothetical protein